MKPQIILLIGIFFLLHIAFLSAQPQKKQFTKQQINKPNTIVASPQQPAPQQDELINNFNAVKEKVQQSCSFQSYENARTDREKVISSKGDFAEELRNYGRVKSFMEMDNQLLVCATNLLDSIKGIIPVKNNKYDTIVKTEIAHDTVYVNPPIQISTSDSCNEKIMYISIASGSLLLTLLLLLMRVIKSNKIFKKLYEKIHDKLLDEIAERLLVAVGIKDDDKLKEKIKKLIKLNDSRKKGELKLEQYFTQVDQLLE